MSKHSKTDQLQDTGERMVPSYHKGHLLYGEHIVRYESVSPFVKDKVVLDIASGSGYGTAKIAEVAAQVIGVDVDADAIAYAKQEYGGKNINFLQGDGIKIPLDNDAVDVVVSFETIEHIEDYKQFLQEIKRVLKSGGTLIISSPNDLESPEGNHFHVHEFNFKELHNLLKKEFKHVKPYLQGTWLYSSIISGDDAEGDWRREIDTIGVSPLSNHKAMYFQFVCSDDKIDKDITFVGAVAEHWSVRSFQEHNEGVGYLINELKQKLEDQKMQIANLTNKLHIIYGSRSWKLLEKVRLVRNKVKDRFV